MIKINYKHILVVWYLINNFSQLLSNPNPNQDLHSNNYATNLSDNLVNSYNLNYDELLLYSPLKFTANGIQNFLANTYNHPKYAKEVIPHNTGHFMQLLEYGKNNDQDYDYILAVLRLLRQKINSSDYMSANELEKLTGFIPSLLIDYLNPKDAKYHKANSRKLKTLLTRVIENCVSKTLWDCSNGDLITGQILKIGNNLENLQRATIISDEDDLNDLIHMLIDRFIYVLSIAGNDLPLSFYENLSKQLQNMSWMQITEIEAVIDTKLKKIDQAFLHSKIKAQAAQNFGIIS
jgi:hypothetical protein